MSRGAFLTLVDLPDSSLKYALTEDLEEMLSKVPPAANSTLAEETPAATVTVVDDRPVPETPFALQPAKSKPAAKPKKTALKRKQDLVADPRFLRSTGDITVFTEVMMRNPGAEVVLDLETTCLTPWNAPVHVNPKSEIGDTGIRLDQYAGTLDVTPRARILSVAVPAANYAAAFDLDAFTLEEQAELTEALSDAVWVGHNLQFDYQWLLHINPYIRPARIIDTMLLVTACRPQSDIEMQAAVADQQIIHNDPLRDCAADLEKMVVMRASADKRQTKDEDGGAMPLQALALWLLDESLTKDYQKPHNWMLDTMTGGHYDYVMGDVTAPRTLARRLMGISDDASLDDLLQAIEDNPGGKAYRTFEEALHTLVRMQQKGVRWDMNAASTLDAELKMEAQKAADALIQVAPELGRPLKVPAKPTKKEPHPEDKEIHVIQVLMDPDHNPTGPVKDALAKAIQRETGRSVRVSDAENPILDAKALAYDFPDSRVVKLLSDINAPTKARQMLAKFTREARNSRLHPIVGIKAKTGRTSAQEPSLQQVPRDPRFRAIFTAAPGHKIIATDFASIELRIAAALGVRAWRDLKSVVKWATRKNREHDGAGTLYKKAEWLLDDRDVLAWLSDDSLMDIPELYQNVERPERGAPIDHYRAYKLSQLFVWVSAIRKASGGDEARLPFRAAYVSGIDPHLLTAVNMEAQGGRLDLGVLTPLDYIRSADQHALKVSMKGPRQAAKAVNFGALYGQQAAGLHRQGVTGYGLSWTPEDAAIARAAWFRLYPEIGLWQWLLAECYREKWDILDPYNVNSFRLKTDNKTGAGKVYWGSTLSGRKTVSPKLTAAANFQDQGTGAEIALHALATLPENVSRYLVNFVHDELVLEVPEAEVPSVQAVVEKTMIEAADRYLLPYGVPTEVESAVGDYWIH